MDNLSQKLCLATSQTTWDVITEYYLLTSSVCEKLPSVPRKQEQKPLELSSKEVVCDVLLNLSTQINVKPSIKQLKEAAKVGAEQPKVLVTRISRKRMKYVPLNSKVQRSILFENYKAGAGSQSAKLRQIPLTPLELGDHGRLTEVAAVTLRKWLEFGATLQVPSVKQNSVLLANRHLLTVPIKELQKMINQLSQDTTKVFRWLPTGYFVPYTSSHSNTKCIMISRNFELWKAFMTLKDSSELADVASSPNLKHIQKFAPIVTGDGKFVPRQKILWAVVESGSIAILTYNWSKENVDKLIEFGKNIGFWLSVRAGVLNSVIAQKLGLFYNQAATRKTLVSTLIQSPT